MRITSDRSSGEVYLSSRRTACIYYARGAGLRVTSSIY